MYSIIVKLDVNWAQVMFNIFITYHPSFLPYGDFLTYIFKKFKVDLQNESNVITSYEIFDHYVILQMKIQSIEDQSQSSTQARPSTQHLTPLHEP